MTRITRYIIFNVPIDNVTMAEAIIRMENMLRGEKKSMIFTPNPEILLRASQNATYTQILQSADLSLPDGIGLVWMGRVLGMQLQERIAGIDVMIALCALAEKNNKSVFLLGGFYGVTHKTVQVLKQKFPKLSIAGYSENLDIEVLKKTTNILSADIVFVALGASTQEKWIVENKNTLPNLKIAMAVGGAFDMLSGKFPRAPKIMQKFGVEWMWRLFLEPRRLRRIFNAVIIFPIKVLWLKNKNNKSTD